RRIFARDGFEACRIEDVAAATGHTRGAFYAHFRTKEDLFFAMLEQEARRRVEQIRAILARCQTEPERRAALRAFFTSRITDRRWAMLIMEFKLFAVRHPELRRELAATHRRIRASLHIECLGGDYDDLKKAALEAVLAGVSLEHAYDPLRISKRQATEILGALFDAILSAGASVNDPPRLSEFYLAGFRQPAAGGSHAARTAGPGRLERL
ncbi:MAG TPA: TetR/AcrR family transcriptional regulator, partial [Bryobacteraceae bacterium]|nr:TetR/AcrR family transcriptional regulator [Bryobacteraceae bacterium]